MHKVGVGGALAIALFLLGCRGRTQDSAVPPEAAAPPSNAASDASGSVIAPSRESEAKRIVRSWNDALDRHDVDALSVLYAPKVVFYGPELSRSAVIAAKRRALGASSTFKQELVGELETAPTASGAIAVTFTKRSGAAGKLSDIRATIVVAGEPPAITEERDAASDARGARDPDARCFEAVAAVVVALPDVKRRLAETEAELPKFPDRRMGGIGPMREADGSVTGGLGVHSDERYEGIVWYTVSPDGKLEVSAPDPIAVPRADAARVASACSRT